MFFLNLKYHDLHICLVIISVSKVINNINTIYYEQTVLIINIESCKVLIFFLYNKQ